MQNKKTTSRLLNLSWHAVKMAHQ